MNGTGRLDAVAKVEGGWGWDGRAVVTSGGARGGVGGGGGVWWCFWQQQWMEKCGLPIDTGTPKPKLKHKVSWNGGTAKRE